MAGELMERGMRVEAALPSSGPLVGKLLDIGAQVHVLETIVFRRSIMEPASLFKLCLKSGPAVLKLRGLIKKGGFDLVHSNTGVVIGGALASRLAGTPHVWHFREILTEFGWLWKMHEPLVARTSREIICISGAVGDQFKSSRARHKVTVIHDGIPSTGQTLKSSNSGGSHHTRLLSVGRLAPYKGQDVLLKAMRQLRDRGIEVELTLVGDVFGEQMAYKHELEALSKELGLDDRVRFTGFVPDVAPYLAKADIFILPSTRPEGLGLVVLEAMAAGLPVVATSGGGVAEVINDGVDGILVRPGDHVSLADAVASLVSDRFLSKNLALKGFETATRDFSVEAMGRNLERVYERVLSAGA